MKRSDKDLVIDEENGKGFFRNVNTKGYTFNRNKSFIVFEMKILQGIRVAHIKYLHFENKRELDTLLAYACNFWMGNQIQFIVLKEHVKDRSAVKMLKSLGFHVKRNNVQWMYEYVPLKEGNKDKMILVYR